MRKVELARYEKALRVAAEEAYKSEVVDTEMESSIIGEGEEYCSKEDWIETRMEGWLNEV